LKTLGRQIHGEKGRLADRNIQGRERKGQPEEGKFIRKWSEKKRGKTRGNGPLRTIGKPWCVKGARGVRGLGKKMTGRQKKKTDCLRFGSGRKCEKKAGEKGKGDRLNPEKKNRNNLRRNGGNTSLTRRMRSGKKRRKAPF